MTTQLTLDSFAARQLKDKGIDKILTNQAPWLDAAIEQIKSMKIPDRGLRASQAPYSDNSMPADQIRQRIQNTIGEPNHPNAWGALFRTAMRRGLLIDTGRMTKSSITTSHSRRIPVYQIP